MSLMIEVEHVTEVLLQDGWHQVAANSFSIDTIEFRQKQGVLVENGQVKSVGGPGASWKEPSGLWLTTPYSQILAFKCRGHKPVGS